MPMKPPMGSAPRPPGPHWPARTRLRGARLQAVRAQLLASQPICAYCGRILRPDAWVRDHIVPLAEGGRDLDANTQALCVPCHDAKSQQESVRGQRRVASD